MNSYTISNAQEAGNLGALISSDYSCVVYSSCSNAPELIIDYTQVDDGIVGEVNEDGYVNVSDVVLIVNIALDLMPFNENVDPNDNGVVNVIDVVNLVNIILGV